MEKTILAISGKPGLYLLVSRGRSALIVEALDDTKKRSSVSLHEKITSLNDVSIYTDDEDVLLMKVFEAMKAKEQGAPVSLDPKKATKDQLSAYLAEVLPNYDRDRVYPGDMKKLVSWYNILVREGFTDFEDKKETAEEGEAAAEPEEEKKD